MRDYPWETDHDRRLAWRNENVVSIRCHLCFRSGVPMFVFTKVSESGPSEIEYENPLPRSEFDALAKWVLKQDEELEIFVVRNPNHKFPSAKEEADELSALIGERLAEVVKKITESTGASEEMFHRGKQAGLVEIMSILEMRR